MPKWTKEQQEAIDARDQNLLVSAAAGSGKTAVLIERIVGLMIKDEVPIDTFLIATYTNAAAGEMRERLLKKILEKLEERPEDKFLKDQMSRLSLAQISTIHSFCITVVRTYFYKLGLDPTFKMGDTYDLELLREEAVNDVFEKAYFLQDDAFIELIEAYTGNRGDRELREMVLKVYDFVLSKPNPFDWLENVSQRYDVAEDTNYWLDRYKGDIKEQLLDSRQLLEKCMPYCQVEEGPMEYLPAIESDLATVDSLVKALDTSLEAFNELLIGVKSQRLKTVPKARKEVVDVELQDQVKELRKLYKKVIDGLKKSAILKDEAGITSEFIILHKRLQTLLDIVKQFKEAYQAMKMEKNLLDFSDLEHYTIQLLNEEDVQQNLQKKFNYIFVDEYQDANEIQEAIIQGIARDNNVFMVGDVKQSIYKFRLADPSIFLSKMDLFKAGGHNRRIDLSKNFRSKASILEGTNELFKRLMSKEFGEIEYDEAAYLYPGREDAYEETKAVEVQLIVDDKEEDGLDDALLDLKSIEKEAHYISKRIHDLKEGEDYDYNDMVILLRGTKDKGPIMAEIFAQHGIPTYLEASGEYFEAIEVKMLIALLRIVDNIEQDIPLLTVMRSPIGGFTTEEMVRIRKDDKMVTYYEAMSGYLLMAQDGLADKIRRFLLKIEGWAHRSLVEPLESLIWTMVHDNGFLSFIEALPEGDRRLKNIEVLMEKVTSLQQLGGLSLFKLIKVLEKIEDFSVDMGGGNSSQQETSAVKIMTIHKSKGLEFPVVFLADSNKRFNLRDAQGHLLLHKDHGLGLKYVDPWKRLTTKSIPQLVIQRRITEENLAEEMRVLYVALTRAVDRLIITGAVKNIESSEKKWGIGSGLFNLKRASSYLDWTMMLLNDDQVDRQYFHVEKQTVSDVFHSNRLSADNQERVMSLLSDFEVSAKVIETFDALPTMDAFEEEETLPAKVSVSALKRMEGKGKIKQSQDLPALVRQPRFMMDETVLAPEERGTRIHNLFRHIAFNKVDGYEDLKTQIDQLASKGLVQVEGLVEADYKKMMLFFDTDLGKRIVKADKVKRETPFVYKKKIDGEEVLVQGIIDLYIEENDYIVLVDFKTDRINKSMVSKRSAQYQTQIDLYTEALEGITGKPVSHRFLYFLELGMANKL